MKRILLLLFVSLVAVFVLNNTALYAQNPKLKDIAGEWIGELKFGDETIYFAHLFIGKDQQGEFSMPEIYNTSFSFNYKLDGSDILLSESKIIKGYNLHSAGINTLKFTNGVLTGVWNKNGNELSKIELQRLEDVPATKINGYKAAMIDSDQKYGVVSHGSTLDSLKARKFFEKAIEYHRSIEFPEFFQMNGIVESKGVSGTVISRQTSPHNYYFELSLGDLYKLASSSTDTLDWVYDSTTKTTTLTRPKKGETPPTNNDFLDFYFQDGRFISVVEGSINGQPVYRVELQNNKQQVAWFYLTPDNYDVVRKEVDFEIESYEEYKKIGEYRFPFLWKFISMEYSMTMKFTDYSTDPFDKSIFNLPDKYKAKIVHSSTMSDEDYFDEGVVLAREKKFEEAAVAFGEAIKLENGITKYWFNRGGAYQMNKEYYKAIDDFNTVIKLNPNHSRAYNRLGVCKIGLGDYKNAITDLEKAISIDSTYSEPHQNLFTAEVRLGNYEKAVQIADKVISFDVDSTANYGKGVLLIELEHYEEALEELKKSIAKGFDEAKVYNYMGVAHFRLGDYSSAKVSYLKALELENNEYLYYNNLADTYYHLEEYNKAVNMYNRCASFKEFAEDAETLKYFARTLRITNNYEEALQRIDQAITLSPNDAEVYDIKGLIKHDMGEYATAIELYTRSIGLYPDDPYPYYWRGLAHESAGDIYDACQDFKKASDLDLAEADGKVKEYCSSIISE